MVDWDFNRTEDALEAHRRLTTKPTMELIGRRSRTTLWSKVKEGKLPAPIY